jgi:hypothetical protein
MHFLLEPVLGLCLVNFRFVVQFRLGLFVTQPPNSMGYVAVLGQALSPPPLAWGGFDSGCWP